MKKDIGPYGFRLEEDGTYTVHEGRTTVRSKIKSLNEAVQLIEELLEETRRDEYGQISTVDKQEHRLPASDGRRKDG